MIVFHVELGTTDEQRPAFVALLERTMAACQKEAGCLVYRCAVDLTDSNLFHLSELWEDEVALLSHVEGRAFRDFFAALPTTGRIVSSVARQGDLVPYQFKRPALTSSET